MIVPNTYPLLRGIASYILPIKVFKRPGTGGTYSSEYCYSVWLRHLHYLIKNDLYNSVDDIKKIAEIGPGDSLGIGIASIYTGADSYYAFDIIKHASNEKNISINEELYTRYTNHEPIPNTVRQRFTAPQLPSFDFPNDTIKHSNEYFEQKREDISRALRQQASSVSIEYIVPWTEKINTNYDGLDLIFSQAVMEHVDDIEYAYKKMYKWLKPGGVISHQIDFKTHEMTKQWNGHWFIGKSMWNILAHGRKYPMNRLPLSSHVQVIEKVGFKIKFILPVKKENILSHLKTKVPGVTFSDDDLITSGALIQAIKI